MSYILEALRKSDEQRRRGETPTLLTPQVAIGPAVQAKLLQYGLLAVALVAVGIAIGWLGPWQSARPLVTPTASPAVAPASAPDPARPVASVAAPPPAPPAVQAKPQPRRNGREAIATAAKSPAKPAPRAAEPPRAGEPASEPRIVMFSELPLTVQQEIPRMAITVHAYSAVPAQRLVGINELLLHEGDSVTADLKLERITPDGMVMSYKGYRFQRGVK